MIHLLLAALAVFAVWEFVLEFLPAQTPTVIHPVLVGALAVGSGLVPEQALIAGAVAGSVGLLHMLARTMGAEPDPISFRLPRRSRSAAPAGVGNRIPSIP